MIFLLVLLLWQSPPAPKPGPAGSDPRYVNRYFEPAKPEGDAVVPKSGVVKIKFSDGFVSPPTCEFSGVKIKEFVDITHNDYQVLRAERGTLHYKCAGQVRRKLKAIFYQGRWVCEIGWRPFDTQADESHPQACLEAWNGDETMGAKKP
jgi:hypothetical protein